MKTTQSFAYLYGICSLLWSMLMVGCGATDKPSHPRDPDPAQVECVRRDSFGDLNVCLPKIPGWEECWQDPGIQQYLGHIDDGKGKMFGLYLDPEDAAHPSDTLNWERKFLGAVVSIELAKNVPITTDTLDHLIDQMASISKDIAWDSKTGELITPNKMIPYSDFGILEKYTQPNGIRTAALVQRDGDDQDARLLLATMNVVMIHHRFLGYFYYETYRKGSIPEFLRQNDRLGSYLVVGNP